jgi:hypothetical protein
MENHNIDNNNLLANGRECFWGINKTDYTNGASVAK